MAGKCSQSSCYPEDTGCNVEGCDKLTDCKYYDKGAGEQVMKESNSVDNLLHIPWTGNSMGLEDLNFLTASSSAIVIGITGVADAGKTTFLAMLYCLLRHGRPIGNYTFAGSKTLIGWENIAWYLSWKENNEIQFPPHTSSNSGRIPGLLHLALRDDKGQKKDVIFTDAPGEWFDKWSYNKDDLNAQGAEWIHRHADAFLLFADCSKLSGETQGKTRRQIKQVADRLCDELYNRPLGMIWSKSDTITLGPAVTHISDYMDRMHIVNYKSFSVSVKEGDDGSFHQSVLNSIAWIVQVLENNANPPIKTAVQAPKDLFLSKRVLK